MHCATKPLQHGLMLTYVFREEEWLQQTATDAGVNDISCVPIARMPTTAVYDQMTDLS